MEIFPFFKLIEKIPQKKFCCIFHRIFQFLTRKVIAIAGILTPEGGATGRHLPEPLVPHPGVLQGESDPEGEVGRGAGTMSWLKKNGGECDDEVKECFRLVRGEN